MTLATWALALLYRPLPPWSVVVLLYRVLCVNVNVPRLLIPPPVDWMELFLYTLLPATSK